MNPEETLRWTSNKSLPKTIKFNPDLYKKFEQACNDEQIRPHEKIQAFILNYLHQLDMLNR